MGIGTLIVFIAILLVAAIAAGVLINTAGFLQTQAESTGEASSEQVSNNINVIGTVGKVNADPAVDEIRLTVQKAAGAGDIDLSGLPVEYVGPSSFGNLVHHSNFADENLAYDSSIPAENQAYLIDDITAETSGDNVMTKEGDRYEIIIVLSYTPNTWINVDTNGDGTGDTYAYDGPYSEQLERTLPTITSNGGAAEGTDGKIM